jgi:hypothetical protein
MLYSYRGAFHFFAWLGQAQPLLYYKCPLRGIVVAGLVPIGVNLSQKYRNKRKKRGGRPSGGKVKAFIT